MADPETQPIVVNSPNVHYDDECITSRYVHETVEVECNAEGHAVATPQTRSYVFRTRRRVPKTGLLIVGLGGNNGTTVVAGILANLRKLEWRTKRGVQKANWYGSTLLSSVVKMGYNSRAKEEVFVPVRRLVPLCDPCELVVGGWDLSSLALGDAMRRAEVLDVGLQDQLYEEMQGYRPMPGVFFPDFVAKNQSERVDNVLHGSRREQLEALRGQIRDFKARNSLEKVIVMWSATTERFTDILSGVNDSADALLRAIDKGHEEIAPSTLYAVASILEGCSYINGSPQNTCVPGVVELASREGVFIGGDDFKSGQTKMKSNLVDFLVSSGIKPRSIVSYNHLGNNDGRNLSSPEQFRSKEVSKSNVVDDIIASNRVLYSGSETIDHTVVIKYVPYVGDSKRAMDEYTSEIFMGGANTIVLHNTCEDSLLAAPLLIDMVLLTELAERVWIGEDGEKKMERMHSVFSLLGYFCKAPMVPEGAPRVNALFSQREAIVNFLRACAGLPVVDHMMLEHRLKSETPLRNGAVLTVTSS